jgi:hypothetical protein
MLWRYTPMSLVARAFSPLSGERRQKLVELYPICRHMGHIFATIDRHLQTKAGAPGEVYVDKIDECFE